MVVKKKFCHLQHPEKARGITLCGNNPNAKYHPQHSLILPYQEWLKDEESQCKSCKKSRLLDLIKERYDKKKAAL
jgi:hypothetical protein